MPRRDAGIPSIDRRRYAWIAKGMRGGRRKRRDASLCNNYQPFFIVVECLRSEETGVEMSDEGGGGARNTGVERGKPARPAATVLGE